jgi:hypothetical protein
VEPEVSRRRNLGRVRRVLAAAFCALALVSVAAAPAAMAGDPAPGEYTLHLPNAGSKSADAGAKVGDSGGSGSAVPILALGAVVIAGGAGALAYARRRRQTGATT